MFLDGNSTREVWECGGIREDTVDVGTAFDLIVDPHPNKHDRSASEQHPGSPADRSRPVGVLVVNQLVPTALKKV